MNGEALKILQEVWGYSRFRPMQEEIIESVLTGYDTLALMPTGGGKSITFQIPALLSAGICIVITPLVALMKDQVDALRARKVKAGYLHAGQTHAEAMGVLDNCLYGDYKLLYVSPERLQSKTFLGRIQDFDVSLIVVDESHCICQWGYDFRPSYLRISEFRKLFPQAPCLALTATATPPVVEDICRKLGFRTPCRILRKSFYRPSLSYVVRETSDKPRELLHILRSVPGSALVYLRSRMKTEKYAELLKTNGISADFFHAGLSPKVKMRKQKEWQEEKIRVMVCTTAFGMGIDKDNVRLVIHPELPPTPEGYYQEAGRAGRDNRRAYAVLLYDPSSDARIMRQRLAKSYPQEKIVQRIYEAMCNFFELAEWTAEGSIHEMNIPLFASRFGFSYYTIYSALELLSLGGYIEYMEDKAFSSRLRFTLGRHELYDLFDEGQEAYDDVVECLLRTYTGLFSDYTFIDEEVLCSKLGIKREVLYLRLMDLSRWHIIDYIPGKRSNFVRFVQARLPKKLIRLGSAIYKERYEADKKRLEAMLEYVETKGGCRVRKLLEYFGEEYAKPCGWCDYCLSNPTEKLSYRDIDRLLDILQRELDIPGKALPSETLARQAQIPPEQWQEAITFVLHQGHPYEITEQGITSLLSTTSHEHAS